jgi:GDP-4-dehydro-6-deoxy-D-mannose reductase
VAEYALGKGALVFGSSRWRSKTESVEDLRSLITLIESDLRDLFSVQGLVEAVNPSHVIHLAAQSFVGASWQTPARRSRPISSPGSTCWRPSVGSGSSRLFSAV